MSNNRYCQIKNNTIPSKGMNGRLNRTLLSMLGTLAPEQKSDWKAYIGPLIHAYNTTKHETIGFSPLYLMFAREPNLPVDLLLGLDNSDRTKSMSSYIMYVHIVKERLKSAYNIASTATKIGIKAQGHL